jgi:hypothetical protein
MAERRDSTMLWWHDTGRIISPLDGRLITAMPIPARKTGTKVEIVPEKVTAALVWADEQRAMLLNRANE